MNFKEPVVLVGGAPAGEDAFELSQRHAKLFVGVDAGGDTLLRRGTPPEAVIGDMDSLSEAARHAIPADRLIEVAEQDSTDFEKALLLLDAPLILALGFTGARLDHELATFHGLVRYPQRPVIVIGAEDIVLHLPARLALELPEATRVSLFPLDAVTVGMAGLEWSFEALDLHPARKIGTSNRAMGGAVDLRASGPGCLLLVPHSALDEVIAALARADFHSPPG